MPWTVMSDAEVAEVLRTVATVHESGDAGQMLGDLNVDRLRAKADLLDPPPVKAGDIVKIPSEVDEFEVAHIRYNVAWVAPVSGPEANGRLVPTETLEVVKRV